MKDNQYRIGMIVPSSNTTMETEIPQLFRWKEGVSNERFTFHSSRSRMHSVNISELKTMNDNAVKCVHELMDADIDVIAYACLVAVMSEGRGFHEIIRNRFTQILQSSQRHVHTSVISSAGSLITALNILNAKKIAFLCPYSDDLTEIVIDYFKAEEFDVIAYKNFCVTDNIAVSHLNPENLIDEAQKLDYRDADVFILSACVQMPSLSMISLAEKVLHKPVISAAVATTYMLLKALGLATYIPGGGSLLSGRYD